MKIFVAGNSLLEFDSLPIRIMGKLQEMFPEIGFQEFDPTENFPEEKELIILDTVVGLKKVQVLDEATKFEEQKPYSLHDFDLGLNLKLMKKAGLLAKFTIIGVPPELKEEEALEHVEREIKNLIK